MEWMNNMHVVAVALDKLEFLLAFSFCVLDMGDNNNNNKNNKNKNKSKMSRRTEMESFNINSSLDSVRFSRDFLTRFMGSNSSSGLEKHRDDYEEDDDDDNDNDNNSNNYDEIELNLGLSLGGRFGVDKIWKKNKLIRSSSIAACLPVVRDDYDSTSAPAVAAAASSVVVPPVAYSSLVRTSSLPVETEEEWRKRKELQTLRRMEAKRRRSEKQRNMMKSDQREPAGTGTGGGVGIVVGGGGGLTAGEEEKKDSIEHNLKEQQWLAAAKRFSSSVVVAAPPPPPPPHLVGASVSGRHSAVLGGGGIDAQMSKGKRTISGTNLGQLLMSQGSVESHSQGGSFSSEIESKSLQVGGSSSCSDLSPGSIQSSSTRNEQQQDLGSSSSSFRTKTKGTCLTAAAEFEYQLKKKSDTNTNKKKNSSSNTLEDMPCVFTKGDGPNGRRVDGILYKYGKGEEVRIMCVCHGNFLSPAEFIKHAGGTDVTHPLKHIVINPNASPFP